jgi:hypothetical protein
MAPDTPITGRPPYYGRPAPAPGRAARVLLATLLIVALSALIAAPAASAATAPGSSPAASSQRVILADPAPAPSPSATNPGIGLGPGSPTGPSTAPTPVTTSDPGTGGGSNPSFFDIPGQIEKAIDDWFGSLIADAMTPMLDLLGSTLLGTPDVTQMPGVQRLWTQMALLANSLYILLVLAGAVIVTTHGTVQSKYSAKEIVPRLAVGMIAGNASIAVLALMIHLADALAIAILGGTINPSTAGQALGNLLGGSAGNSIFLILLELGASVMLIAILLTYIVRVAFTVVLAVAAPLALSLHALPGPDSLARLWWKAITGVFLIQLGQSLVFVIALDVMLDPNANVSMLGLPNNSALVDTLLFLALCWILIKIPVWVGRSILGGGGSRLLGMAKAVIAYKTLGALGMKRGPGGLPLRKKTGTSPNRPRPQGGPGAGGSASGPRRPGPGPRGTGGANSGGGVTWTVTQVHPNPPTKPGRPGLGTSRPGLPQGASAPTGQGPRLALEAGPSAHNPAPPHPGTSANGTGAKPRYRQMTLPIKATRTPRPAPPTPVNPPTAGSASGSVPARPRQVQRGLFPLPPRPAAAPRNPTIAATAAPVAVSARLAAAPKPTPATAPRPTPATAPTAPRPARMSTPPPLTHRPSPTQMPPRRTAPAPALAPEPVRATPARTPTPAPVTARANPAVPRPKKATS